MLTLATECGGEVLPALNTEWTVRKSEECELMLAASMLYHIMDYLMKAALANNWHGKYRDLYNNAGRAIRLCDSLQHRCLEACKEKGNCKYCLEVRRK
jgi:hypothetical protein